MSCKHKHEAHDHDINAEHHGHDHGQDGNHADQIPQKASITTVNVEEAKRLMTENKDLILLDVRTPGEIADGKIPNALEIDYQGDDFEAKIDKLDKDATYLVYCKAGGRSTNAAKMMQEKGYGHIYNLEGGYTAWSKE